MIWEGRQRHETFSLEEMKTFYLCCSDDAFVFVVVNLIFSFSLLF